MHRGMCGCAKYLSAQFWAKHILVNHIDGSVTNFGQQSRNVI